MARGGDQNRISTWDRCSADLVHRRCQFRLRRRTGRSTV